MYVSGIYSTYAHISSKALQNNSIFTHFPNSHFVHRVSPTQMFPSWSTE